MHYGQTLIEIRPGRIDPKTLFEQIKKQHLSHIVLNVPVDGSNTPGGLADTVLKLEQAGCAIAEKLVPSQSFGSRTLKGYDTVKSLARIWRVNSKCNI